MIVPINPKQSWGIYTEKVSPELSIRYKMGHEGHPYEVWVSKYHKNLLVGGTPHYWMDGGGIELLKTYLKDLDVLLDCVLEDADKYLSSIYAQVNL